MALVMPSARRRSAAALLLVLGCAVMAQPRVAVSQEIYGNRAWVGVEYLRWELEGTDLPPLVTAGPDTEPLDEVGQLDNPTTQILFGDEEVGGDWRNGYRIFAGYWLDDCGSCAIVGDYFRICDDDFDFEAGDTPGLIITRPFFNTETGEDDTQLVSVPDELSGTVEVEGGDDFQGAGIAAMRRVWCCCDPCGPMSTISLLGGYRYYRYDSDLVITEDLLVLPNTTSPMVPGTTIFLQDEFRTENEFHGGELGIQGLVRPSWWWIDGLAKFAIGSHHREVSIDGQTINTVPNVGTEEFEGGLLTSEVTNIGEYSDTTLAIIPEFRLGIGGQIWKGISVRAGYNVILWNAVAQAGNQLPPGLEVDQRNLPPVQAGGGPEPEFPGIRGSSFVAHGFDFAIQWAY
jgi:hypothetical protein